MGIFQVDACRDIPLREAILSAGNGTRDIYVWCIVHLSDAAFQARSDTVGKDGCGEIDPPRCKVCARDTTLLRLRLRPKLESVTLIGIGRTIHRVSQLRETQKQLAVAGILRARTGRNGARLLQQLNCAEGTT
jgi:hypothetical protein